MSESELRRQATAAGVFLDLRGNGVAAWDGTPEGVQLAQEPLTDDEADQLLVWLDRWQEPDEPRERHEDAWCCQDCGRPVGEPRPGARPSVVPPCETCLGASLDALPTPVWQLPIVRPLLDPPVVRCEDGTESRFELVRKSWCPRCDRVAGDPLGRPVDRRRCEVVPPAPLLEVGPGCSVGNLNPPIGMHHWQGNQQGMIWHTVCGARRLYRWGIRRAFNETDEQLRERIRETYRGRF